MNPVILIWLILLTPLLGFGVGMTLGRKQNALVGWVTTGFSGLALVAALLLLFDKTLPQQHHWVFDWFAFGNQPIRFGFLADSLTLMMLVLVNFIAVLVQLFSQDYMHEDPDQYRYFSFLQLFVFSMLGIVLTDNLFVMYGFWELVGLSSYLLIGFWYKKASAVQAAKKAFLVNRVGDIGFLLGIFGVYFYNNGSTDFTSLGTTAMPTVVGLLLFCGCVGKSAQFPLHTWLPDAMEGPTPVSALIHAATMVAAGIFLVARIQPILTPDAQEVIAGVGCVTMLLGSAYAIFQTDIKKTLAYSTVSQLGLMLLGLGTEASVFHLLTHAFFKAGLFLSAGAVIHALHHGGHHHDFDAQDTRLMGGLRKQLPFTFACYVIFAASLAGLPLFSGFLSKDTILANLFQLGESNPYFTYLGYAVLLGVFLTAFYMTRQVLTVFFGEFRNPLFSVKAVHEGSWKLKMPLALLAILSTGVVFSLNPLNAGHSWFWHFLNPMIEEVVENHTIAIVSVAVGMAGILTAYLTKDKVIIYTLPTFDGLYNWLFVAPTLALAKYLQVFDTKVVDFAVNALVTIQVQLATLSAWVDQTFVDGVPNGLATGAGIIGKVTRSVQGGKVQLYIVSALVGLGLLIVLLVM